MYRLLKGCLLMLFSFSVLGQQIGSPLVVGKNVVSTSAQEFGATATPDGKDIYYSYTNNGYTRMTLLHSTYRDSRWQTPTVLPFSGQWNDADASLSPDGKRLYFISSRPIDGKRSGNLEIWYVEREEGNWGAPKPVRATLQDEGSKTYPSIASDGTLYYSFKGQVYLSRLKDGVHQPKEMVNVRSSSVSIAPDQSFMILHHRANKDAALNLAISYNEAGIWTTPVDLPAPINSTSSESSPNLSADGKTLYFTSTRVDWSKIQWPRNTTLRTFEQVESELLHSWENGLRNIYKVELLTELINPK